MSRAELAALHSRACERASVRVLMVHVPVLAAFASQSLESWNSMHLSRLLSLPGLSWDTSSEHPNHSGGLGGLVWPQAVVSREERKS